MFGSVGGCKHAHRAALVPHAVPLAERTLAGEVAADAAAPRDCMEALRRMPWDGRPRDMAGAATTLGSRLNPDTLPAALLLA